MMLFYNFCKLMRWRLGTLLAMFFFIMNWDFVFSLGRFFGNFSKLCLVGIFAEFDLGERLIRCVSSLMLFQYSFTTLCMFTI